MARTIDTGKAVLTWSADGTSVTKTATYFWDDPLLGDGRRLFRNEQRVNRMLATARPPAPVPALLATGRRCLTVEAIDGEPLGPKFPTELADDDVHGLVHLATAMARYRPSRRWFRSLDIDRRIALHEDAGLLSPADALLLRDRAARRPRFRFAHADITARNVLRRADGTLVLIDWEWAGVYPPGYDLAFLWFSLAELPAARATVAAAVPPSERRWFTVSALLVQLLHLHMWQRRGTPPRPVHLATRDELLAAIADPSSFWGS